MFTIGDVLLVGIALSTIFIRTSARIPDIVGIAPVFFVILEVLVVDTCSSSTDVVLVLVLLPRGLLVVLVVVVVLVLLLRT